MVLRSWPVWTTFFQANPDAREAPEGQRAVHLQRGLRAAEGVLHRQGGGAAAPGRPPRSGQPHGKPGQDDGADEEPGQSLSPPALQ